MRGKPEIIKTSEDNLRHWTQNFQVRLDQCKVGDVLEITCNPTMVMHVIEATREYCNHCSARFRIRAGSGVVLLEKKEEKKGEWHPWMERK
jgi:hypothetical protein